MTRLYSGTGAFDIIGNRRRWYVITAVLVLVCLGSIIFRGFNLGIDFEGGTQIQFPAGGATVSEVEEVYSAVIGTDPVTVQTVGSGGSSTIQIRSETLDANQVDGLRQALFDAFRPAPAGGEPSLAAISDTAVSDTWGSEITQKAIVALIVFLVLVGIFIGIVFERDMAIAALAALAQDLIVTAGVYSLIGFEVTPGTVIGLLTILGFSLYDTVVVFDKVHETTRGVLHLTRRTYAEQANLAVNQTIVRSVNTTVIAVLPVLGLLVIGVWLLGVGTLKDLALVQLTGLVVGTFSSIFLATPLVVTLRERKGEVAVHTKKVLARRKALAAKQAGAPEAAVVGGADVAAVRATTATTTPRTPVRPTRPTKPNQKRGSAPSTGARPTGKRKR
ncbi:protein translocase subunit SecF [Rhodococcus sp. X156]|uniref:protein translocase subunit SecF n=1 Tax=Rhodococcus sp. X156 TaxID=2499145 RepID=UPI001F493453|nr:protein translocase subunit SecF [Rhodococcus sp. X156]